MTFREESGAIWRRTMKLPSGSSSDYKYSVVIFLAHCGGDYAAVGLRGPCATGHVWLKPVGVATPSSRERRAQPPMSPTQRQRLSVRQGKRHLGLDNCRGRPAKAKRTSMTSLPQRSGRTGNLRIPGSSSANATAREPRTKTEATQPRSLLRIGKGRHDPRRDKEPILPLVHCVQSQSYVRQGS